MTNEQAAAYLAGLIDGEGCVCLSRLTRGKHAGEYRRTIAIGMTDREIIDLAASLFLQLGIGFSRSDRHPGGHRRHVWTIAVNARADIERLAELVPIQHPAKQERLAAILGSYKTAKVYARRADHGSAVAA